VEEPAAGPHAVVRIQGRRRYLSPGETLSIGRGSDQEWKIGQKPLDEQISRSALHLECRSDGVLITNCSLRNEVRVEPELGTPFVLWPQGLVGSQPYAVLRLVLHGNLGLYQVHLDTSLLVSSPQPKVQTRGPHLAPESGEPRTTGADRLEWISDKQRELMFALSLPERLGWRGKRFVPNYGQMSLVLLERGRDVKKNTIRNALLALRKRLAADEGVWNVYPLLFDEALSAKEFLTALEDWAWRSGNVTEHELEVFDARGDRQTGS